MLLGLDWLLAEASRRGLRWAGGKGATYGTAVRCGSVARMRAVDGGVVRNAAGSTGTVLLMPVRQAASTWKIADALLACRTGDTALVQQAAHV